MKRIRFQKNVKQVSGSIFGVEKDVTTVQKYLNEAQFSHKEPSLGLTKASGKKSIKSIESDLF